MSYSNILYLEGDNDKKLLEQLVRHWGFNNKAIEIKVLGGYSKIINRINELEKYNDKGDNILVLFDADSIEQSDKNNGFERKSNYLKKLKTENSIDFEHFLFPNNKEDGTLEDFIKSISKHKELYDCWDKLWVCVKSQNSNVAFSQAGKKSMIYYYIECLFGTTQSEQKEMKKYISNIDFSDDKWEIDKSPYAIELKQFLENNLK